MARWLLILLVLGCGREGPLVIHGKDSPEVEIAGKETESYFATKGLEPGWTSSQLVWIEPQEMIDKVCQRHVASCVTSPWHIYVTDALPIKQLLKHELAHNGGYKLGHLDPDHTYWTEFWNVEQWK